MATEMSDSDLSSDWTVISPVDGVKVETEENESSNISSGGSSADVIENESIQKGSAVESVEDQECASHTESSSSSDIDVIDENLEDIPMSISLPSSDLTISTSTENFLKTSRSFKRENAAKEIEGLTNSPRPADSSVFAGAEEWFRTFASTVTSTREKLSMPIITLLMILTFIFGIFIADFFYSFDFGETERIEQIKEIIQELKFENKELKNQMISEIQNEKVFATLEGQIGELKNENFKLSEMLQDVILELQKQTIVHEEKYKRREVESQGIFQNEINKLKEQINILQFDNEELQNQLVRMRYGSYPSHSQSEDDAKPDVTAEREKTGESFSIPGNEDENISENLAEEVRKLRNDLHSEVLKLKKWNELIEHLSVEIQKPSKNRDSFRAPEFSDEEKASKRKKYEEKSKKFFEWTWKDLKKSLRGTIDNFQKVNVSEIFTKYMPYDKKQVDDAVSSIGTYFNKAREEAKKMFQNSHHKKETTKDTPTDVRDKWFGELVNTFNDMKNYFKLHFGDEQAFEENEYSKPQFYNGFSSKSTAGSSNFKMTNEPKRKLHKTPFPAEDFTSGLDEKSDSHFEQSDKDKFSQHSEKESAWMFERAAYRAKLRENEKDSPINWYLRRKRDAREDVYPSDHNEEKQNTHSDERKYWKMF